MVLEEVDRQQLRRMLARLDRDVELVLFTQGMSSEHSGLAQAVVREVSECAPQIGVEVHDFVRDAEMAKALGIERIPALAVMGQDGSIDYGIRFYGPPVGYQLAVLAQDIVRVSRGDGTLPLAVRDKLAALRRPVHMRVLVTATCPYCASMVLAAHRFAQASDLVQADMVDVGAFPFMAVKYQAEEVPCTVIDDAHRIGGLMSESQLADMLLRLQREAGN